MTAASFPFSFNRAFALLSTALGVPPRKCEVTVNAFTAYVQFGWMFSCHIPLHEITRVERITKPFLAGYGVHGWRGRWWVNGSKEGMVRLHLSAPQEARLMGITLCPRELNLGLEDPDGFIKEIRDPMR